MVVCLAGLEGAGAQPIDTTTDASDLPPDSIPVLRPTVAVPTVVDPAKGRKTTAAMVAGAPSSDHASGVSRDEPDSAGNRWRVLPRVLLFAPRVALEVIDAPIRGALYSYDRFSLAERARDVFFNDEGTVGLYPVGDISTDFGFTGGGRFFLRDLLGAREEVNVRASFGGMYNQQYSAEVSSGDRFGRWLRLETQGDYEISPRERFFGIGNGDQVDMVAAPVDPYSDRAAIDTRFREMAARAFARARLRLDGPLSARLTSGALWKRFASSRAGDIAAGDDIAEHYLTDEIPAFEDGAAYTYNELELRYDSRRESSPWEPASTPSTGWLILGYGGVARGFDRSPTRYVRYGGDVQRYFRLAQGPRVMVVRAVAEEVRGETDAIPFVDLPALGGPMLLRGYVHDRFRDRAMAVTSVEYQFDLGTSFAGFLFTDAGRVFPRLAEVTTNDVRVGFGGGVQLHSASSYLGRLMVASSRDGGFVVNLSFDPVYRPQKRLELD